MSIAWTAARWNRLALLALLLAIWACGDDGGSGCDSGCGDGCGCDGDDGPAYVFPESGTVMHQAVQVKLTEHGIAFLEDNLDPILGEVLGEDGLSFCLEEMTQSGFNLCYNHEQDCAGCNIEIELNDVRLEPVAPSRLDLSAAISIEQDIPVNVEAIGVEWISCILEIRGNNVPVTAGVQFDVAPPPGERTSARILLPDDEGINEILDGLNLKVRPRRIVDLALCGIADALKPLLLGIAKDQLLGPLDDAVAGIACLSCGDGCPGGSTCDSRGICMAGDACVPQALGMEGEFNIGDLLSDFAPGLDSRLGYMAYLANYANAIPRREPVDPTSGLELAAQIGVDADRHACVPDTYKDWPEVFHPRSEAINAGFTPGGEPYALGVGIATRALDMALWGVWRSGALCIAIGSETVDMITTGTFGLLLPSLKNITDGRNLPMQLQLSPNRPPEIRLGDGTVEANPDGGAGTIIEPLLELAFYDLDIDAYVWVFDRWLRVFTLNTDIELPVGLDISNESGLYVLLDAENLSDAFTRLEARDGELLDDADLAGIAGLLPTLLGVAAPMLGEALGDPIEIPEFFGFRLRMSEESIQAVDNYETLAIFADLEAVPDAMIQGWGVSVLGVTPVGLVGPELADAYRQAGVTGQRLNQDWIAHRVELLPLDSAFGGGAWDVSYRIAGGLWSMWQPGPSFELRDPRLFMEGVHEVEVRLRPAGQPTTRVAESAVFHLPIDLTPPELEIVAGGDVIEVNARDVVADFDDLQMRWSIDGAWTAWQPAVDKIEWPSTGEAFDLEVEVRDPAGHIASEANRLVRPSSLPAASSTPEPSFGSDSLDDAGCAAAGGSSSGLWVVLAALALVIRRRRRFALGAALIALSLLGAGCGDKGSSAAVPCSEDAPCDEGYICLDGICVDADADILCSETSQCPIGQGCIDGVCQLPECSTLGGTCDINCEDDAQGRCGPDGCFCALDCAEECSDGSFCCAQTGSCDALPDPCGGLTCPTGQRAELQSIGTGNPYTCEVETEGTCECVELDPLSMGDHGRWLDAAGDDAHGIYAAAYNQTYGDLMIGRLDEARGELDWTFVDGLPPEGAAVTGSLDGPRGGVAVAGPNVGRYPAIAVAESGALHVAYQAVDGDHPESLRYAYSEGSLDSWTFIDIDTTRLAGYYSRMLLDDEGRPHIVHLVPRLASEVEEGQPAEWHSELRLIRALSATPESADDFETVLLHRQPLEAPCGGACAGSTRCRADLNICMPSRSRGCSPDCDSNERCFEDPDGGNSCASELTFAPYNLPLEANGMHPALAWLADGTLAVAFYDSIGGRLMGSTFKAAAPAEDGAEDDECDEDSEEDCEPAEPASHTIDTFPVDGGDAASGHVGAFPALYISETDEVYVAYMDVDRSEALIRNLGTETLSVIDEGYRSMRLPYRIGRVGSALVLDEFDGFMTAFYMDATRHELVEARFIFDGVDWSWDANAIEGGSGLTPYHGAAGLFNRLVVTDSSTWVFTYSMNFIESPAVRQVIAIER